MEKKKDPSLRSPYEGFGFNFETSRAQKSYVIVWFHARHALIQVKTAVRPRPLPAAYEPLVLKIDRSEMKIHARSDSAWHYGGQPEG